MSAPARLPRWSQGELWNIQGRLVYDWTYAGYKQGAAPIPVLPVTVDIKRQYGAKGDGRSDDSKALQAALNDMTRGVLFFPAGTYILTSVFNIRKPIVLRGAGKGQTFLRFPKSLTDLFGNTYVEGNNRGTSQYSHGTGFINFGGWDPTGRTFTKLTWVKKDAQLGTRRLYVADTSAIAVGGYVRVLQKDPGDGSLMLYLNGGTLPIPPALRGYPDPARLVTRVTAKGADWITLERPVPYAIRARWAPEIHRVMPLIDGSCCVELLTVSFPLTQYPGHLKELGYNGIHLNQVVNGWVKDVAVVNSDMGVYFWGSAFCTIDGLTIANDGGSRGWFNGHRGIWLEHGSDNLYIRFNQAVRFVHDISVAGTEQGSVFTQGYGADINLDHHRSSPFANLFVDMFMGLGGRVFDASGDARLGTHGAMYETFWNLRSKMNFLLPEPDFAPNMTMVALMSTDNADSPYNWWVEPLARVYPTNLWSSMKGNRAKRLPPSLGTPAY